MPFSPPLDPARPPAQATSLADLMAGAAPPPVPPPPIIPEGLSAQAEIDLLMQQKRQAREAQLRQQLSGLPEVVQRNIMTQPSYSEGGVMAPEQWWNSALGGQVERRGPQREELLQFDRGQALGLPIPDTENPWFRAMPEGGVWSSRPPGISPFASPLNQPLRRPSFGLY